MAGTSPSASNMISASARSIASVTALLLAAPAQRTRLDRVFEGPSLGASAAVFALQLVIPARLEIGVADQHQLRIVFQTFILAAEDVAILAEKIADKRQ